MNVINCINLNCRKQVPINGPWVPVATCTHCGTIHYPPFAPATQEPSNANWASGNSGFGMGTAMPVINPVPAPTPKPEPVQPIGTLISEDNFKQRQEFKLKLGINVIGRACADAQVDIIIADPSISRPHCVIEVQENKPYGWKYLLYDIGFTQRKESSNGVMIPFRATRLSRAEQVELQLGNSFTAGLVKFELR